MSDTPPPPTGPPPSSPPPPPPPGGSGGAFIRPAPFPGQRSRLVAGLLGVFAGGAGVHSFYLGDTKKGVWQIVATVFTCGIGALWGFVEGVMILAGKVNVDADGQPLAD